MTNQTFPTPAQEALNTRLAMAIMDDDNAAIRQAVKDGPDPNAEGSVDVAVYGLALLDMPLARAIVHGCSSAVQALLDAGAAVDGTDDSSLYKAARNGHIAIVKALLEAGATVDPEYNAGNGVRGTPLNRATFMGHREIVDILLAAGADPFIKAGYENWLPVDEARNMDHIELADHLQSIMDDPARRPTPESVGLDMNKRITALEALGKPLGQFTQAERKRVAQRETREAQRQAALRGEGI